MIGSHSPANPARISRLCMPCTGLYGQTARVPLPPDVEAIVATVFGLVGRLGLCKPGLAEPHPGRSDESDRCDDLHPAGGRISTHGMTTSRGLTCQEPRFPHTTGGGAGVGAADHPPPE